MKKTLDWNTYLDTASRTVSEGIVMLTNKNHALPLAKDEEVAVFGRIQLHYYKSGTGSGGMVNVSRVISIVDGLTENNVKINETLLNTYKEWEKEHPYERRNHKTEKETFFFPDYHIGLCRRYFTGGAAFNAAYSHKGKSGDAFS